MVLQDSKVKKKNLSTAWADYRKAFDSVQDSWIFKATEIYMRAKWLLITVAT